MSGYIGNKAVNLSTSGADISGTTNLDAVDIDGAVNMATTALVTGVLTTTAATVFNGGFAANDGSTITTNDNSDNLTLTSTDADASSGPNVKLYRNSSSPADNDFLGNIKFVGRNDNSQDVQYAEQEVYILDASDGTEDGLYNVNVMTAGTNLSYMQFKAGSGVVFNEDSNDIDFRVESNDTTHAFAVDGGNNCVQIGTSSTSNDTCARFGGSGSVFSFKMVNAYGGGTAIYAENTNNQAWIYSRFNTNNSQVGFIQVGTSSTAYSTSGSDKRLKKNFETWGESELSNFETLKPTKFNYNTEEDGTEKTKGFIAQDLVDAFPEAYPLDEQSDRYFFNPSGMVVYLMKAMQESSEKIKSLEARITALENA